MSNAESDAKTSVPPRASILAVAVFTVAVVAFAPSLAGGFVYDDHPLIEFNARVHSFGEWRHWFTSHFWDLGDVFSRYQTQLIFWRPLVTASFAIDWAIGHGSPTFFHLTNLMVNGVAAVLAFRALRRWTDDILASFFAAIVVAVHPTHAESVAWISGRSDVYCFVAVLLCAEGVARRLRKKRGGLAIEVAATIVAYMTKEQAIVLAAFVAIEAWVALGRPSLDRRNIGSMFRTAAPQLAIAIAYLAVRARVMPFEGGAKFGGYALRARIDFPFETLGRFFSLTVAPHDLTLQEGLVRTVSRNGTPTILLNVPFAMLGAVVAIALVAAAIRLREQRPDITLAIALYLGALLPTLNLVLTQMHTMLSERYLYLPLAGPAWMVAIGLGAVLRNPRWVAPTAVVVAIVTLTWGRLSFRRSLDFADEDVLWAGELRMHPDSPDALQYEMHREIAKDELHAAMLTAARAQQTCIASFIDRGCDVDNIVAGTGLLARLTPDGDTRTLGAISQFTAELLQPTKMGAHLHSAAITIDMDVTSPTPKVRLRALRPDILKVRADIASRLGDDATAIELSDDALAECPTCEEAILNASLIRARAGQYDQAVALLDVLAREQGTDKGAPVHALIDRASLYAKESAASEGPTALMLRAKELSTLEAWGRAYAVLAPYRAQIEKAPGFAIGFAELAWRAGAADVARETLRGVVPEDRIEPITLEWSNKMGWGSGKSTPGGT